MIENKRKNSEMYLSRGGNLCNGCVFRTIISPFYINQRLDYEGYMYREVWNTSLHFRKTKFR